MATIIFDFDDTLFHSAAFGEKIIDFLTRNNVPKGKAELTFKPSYDEYGNYDIKNHVITLKSHGYEVPEAEIDIFFNTPLKDLLKGDVLESLQTLSERGHTLILLSKGIEEFQKYKIKQAGLKEVFKEKIFICKNKKEEFVSTIPLQGEIYFVNDNADEIEAVAKKYPEMKFVYIKGPKTAHDRFIDRKHIPTLDDISSLPELIK